MEESATPRPDPLRLPLELDLFEGPLDLMLTLVLREEVDLAELPVAEVVRASLEGEEPWDPPTAGELIVLMAALVDLKSRRLVGEDDADLEPDAEAEEIRERLAQRLIAYAPFQRAAAWLGERAGAAGAVRYRRVPVADAPRSWAAVEAHALAAALERLLLEPPTPSLAHLNTARVNVSELITRLRTALAEAGHVSFETHVADGGPLREGTTLLAALELAHRGEARLEQRVPFGDITIRRPARPSAGGTP